MIKVGDTIQKHCEYNLIEGTCTWVNAEGSHCILNENDTGHLYWCKVKDVSKVNEEEIKMNSFDIGDKVVMSSPFLLHFIAGTITKIITSEEGNTTYVVNFHKDGTLFANEDELYDMEGLQFAVLIDKQNGYSKVVRVVDSDGDVVLVIDNNENVFTTDSHNLHPLGYYVELQEMKTGYDDEECEDNIIAELRDMLLERSTTGIRKYGTTLDRTDLDPSEWCQHLLEELLDAAGYVLRLKKDLEALEVQ